MTQARRTSKMVDVKYKNSPLRRMVVNPEHKPKKNRNKDGLSSHHYLLLFVVAFVVFAPMDWFVNMKHPVRRSTYTGPAKGTPTTSATTHSPSNEEMLRIDEESLPQLDEMEEISEDQLGPCVCKINGTISDCHCGVETVDFVNRKYIRPIIKEIVQQDFFKFYRVNLDSECPFWYEDGFCMTRECAVDSCEASTEVPPGLIDPKNSFIVSKEESCFQVQSINKTLSPEDKATLDHHSSFCAPELDHSECPEGDYVNLLNNPEGYTGYAGESADKVWAALFAENCFKPTDTPLSVFELEEERCIERRVFYRVISGLQASIASHLCHKYPAALEDWDTKWAPNVQEYFRRFSDETTKGEGALWLKNMYFTYLMVLRAIAKSASIWESHPFFVDGSERDAQTKQLVTMLANVAEEYNEHLFDERMLSKAEALELRDHFRNVTRIMSCVGCERCKLWGTLQAHGIGTAMDILFLEEGAQSKLYRNDIVALFNVMEQLSASLEYLEYFQNSPYSSTLLVGDIQDVSDTMTSIPQDPFGFPP